MNQNVALNPLHLRFRYAATESMPVRVFTSFGTFDGIPKVDPATGMITLYPYAETRSADTAYRVNEDEPELYLAPAAILGMTWVDGQQSHRW
ncbi:hypothetical protein [Dietzia sp. 179-F 9C3 NHS]|uniref:hypothetical protein n=1 Tax=Dietzia sp. 179-F 9C3 NHS TaxID=3374295 RepID=UPI00387953F5